MTNNDRDFTIVKSSPVHNKGLFAKQTIPKGTRIIEYAGQRVLKSNLGNDLLKGMTSMIYVMNLNETTVIDAERDGNDARFINHSCDPNCEVLFFNETPYIYAMREIFAGEELFFDYKLGFDEGAQLPKEDIREFLPCNCGAENCRGTLLDY